MCRRVDWYNWRCVLIIYVPPYGFLDLGWWMLFNNIYVTLYGLVKEDGA